MLGLFSKEKPSNSALIAAWIRACAHRDFQNQIWGADYLAECFLPLWFRLGIRREKLRKKGKKVVKALGPGLFEYIMARTLFFDEVVSQALKDSFPQIVFMGAGYDSRGLRFEHLNNGTQIVELDRAVTQNRKIKRLKSKKVGIPEYLKFFAIDFNNQTLEGVLSSAGYQNDQRTLFVWEGVSMYLETQSVKDTLTFIRQCSPPGTLLAFDYAVSLSDKDVEKNYGAKEMLKSSKDKSNTEPFKFSLAENNMTAFLNEFGHNIVRHLNPDQLEQRYLKKEDGSSIGKPNGLFSIVVTTVA